MRRRDREMDRDFARMVADKCPYAVLSMTREDGAPYCVPVSIARAGDALYFHSARDGMKADCLRRDGRVCLACVGDVRPVADKFTTEYESAVIAGRASEVADEAEKLRALEAICRRYAAENMAGFAEAARRSIARTAVWRIDIEEMTGKRKKYDGAGNEMKFGRME